MAGSLPPQESSLLTASLAASTLSLQDYDAASFSPQFHSSEGITLTLQNTLQWKLVHLDDFNTHANGWVVSNNGSLTATSVSDQRSNCGASLDFHLGGYCTFAGTEVSRVVQNLPRHTSLRLTARVHLLDHWQGEYAYAKVDGKDVWMQSHFHCPKPFASFCRGVDACGDNKFADKMSQLVQVTLPHTAAAVTVSFGASLRQPPCAASWAVDDVAIYIQ